MEMVAAEPVRYRDEFYPGGFRKTLAIMIVVGITALPEFFSWANSAQPRATASSFPTGQYRPRGGFLREPEPARPSLLATLGTIVKRTFVLCAVTAGLMMYYPRRGYKRYALVAGPVIALLVPAVLAFYLQGRTEIFRAEILVVTLIAMLPGIALYVFLTWRKAQRQGMTW